MAKIFFQKELPENQFLVNGQAVPFEYFADHMGGWSGDTENPSDKPIIDALNAINGSRGVFKVSEAAYDELKKKPKESESLPSWHRNNGKLQVAPSAQSRQSPSAPSANPPPAPPPPEPPKGPQVSKHGFKPRTMRQSEITPIVEKASA